MIHSMLNAEEHGICRLNSENLCYCRMRARSGLLNDQTANLAHSRMVRGGRLVVWGNDSTLSLSCQMGFLCFGLVPFKSLHRHEARFLWSASLRPHMNKAKCSQWAGVHLPRACLQFISLTWKLVNYSNSPQLSWKYFALNGFNLANVAQRALFCGRCSVGDSLTVAEAIDCLRKT